jgi:hypothetical protein
VWVERLQTGSATLHAERSLPEHCTQAPVLMQAGMVAEKHGSVPPNG